MRSTSKAKRTKSSIASVGLSLAGFGAALAIILLALLAPSVAPRADIERVEVSAGLAGR